MAEKRNPYGYISTDSSARRKKRLRDEAIRTVLATLLICVLVVVIGFLGVNALKGMNQTDKNKETGSESTLPSGNQDFTENEVPGTTESETETPTEAPTDPPTEAPSPTLNEEHIVWLDAGHGGDDWGSAEWKRNEAGQIITANGNPTTEEAADGQWIVREKHDTLELSLLIQKELEERGVTVIMTRTDDTYVHRFDRAAQANESGAECFISIHRNYMLGDRNQCGIEAWLVNEITRAEKPGKEKDEDVVGYIFDELKNLGDKTNGILGIFKETDPAEDISVLFRTNMPAVLLEMGYMSNDSDNEKYKTYMEDYAIAISDGIVRWLQTQE